MPDLEQRVPVARPVGRPAPVVPTPASMCATASEALPRDTATKPSDSPTGPRGPRVSRRPSPFFALIVSLLVGGGFMALLPLSYDHVCALTVLERGGVDPALVRAALMDFLWANESARRWRVATADRGEVRFTMTAEAGAAPAIERLGREFVRTLHNDLVAERPSETEKFLNRLLADAGQRLQDASAVVANGGAASAKPDPRLEREASIGARTELVAQYEQAAAELSRTQRTLDALTRAGVPTQGVVTEDARKQAREADDAVQQDLRELSVRLTELRSEMCSASALTEEKLLPLTEAVDALRQILQGSEPCSNDPKSANAIESLAGSADQYAHRLEGFCAEFGAATQSLRVMIVDPVSDNLVDGYVSLRKLASDFLFDASKLLTAMREQIDAVNESEVAAPRNYMFVSELTRGFGHAQTAHHRFEFAATKIDSANNFRLDAALRGARGLRSRTRDRLAAIEKALQAEALKTAKETYAIDLRDAQIAVLASRRRLDEIVGQLLQADGSVLATIAPSEQFLGAVIRRELAEKAAADERGQIAQLQEIVDDLSTKRKAVAAGSVVELASIETSPAPHDLRRRVELSGAAASIALVSILLGQWWLARRT